MTERELAPDVIEACRRGDRDAFRALYEAYKDKVYSTCLYFFHGDTAEAADVTQEVFLKLFATIAGFRGDSGFSTWLYRLVHNACLDTARRKSIRARAVEGPPDFVASHEQEFLHSADATTIQQAVSSLPPKYRLPILMRHFEDFSYEDMSKALNCSMGTVASRLNRAHKLLAETLGPLRERVAAGGRNG